MNDFITIRIQVKTKVPGSPWQQPIQVNKQWWEAADEDERAWFIDQRVLSLVTVNYEVEEDGE